LPLPRTLRHEWHGGVVDPTDLLETARAAASAAAEVHLRHLGRVPADDWDEKGAADFVTHVDREAESVIVRRIRDRFPGHAILAEEAATAPAAVAAAAAPAGRGTVPRDPPGTAAAPADAAEWSWIVDPLDGTTNYLHGYPMYAVSIAASWRGTLMAAAVLNSASGEEWTAVRGGGAYRNGERVHVSAIDRLPRALVGTGFPFKTLHLLPGYTAQLAAVLRATSGVRRAGSAALDLCHVATGWLDAFWELDLAPWDVAAGTLIIREAGGVVTRMDGSDDVVGQGSILAGSRALHAALGALLHDTAGSSTGERR
jgi:myo-inositol-1(or 4)-monophosphatase